MTGLPSQEDPAGASPPANRMAVALLSLLGLLVSLYLLAHSLGFTGPVLCGVGDCATVQSSEFAWIGPIPVSGLGVVGYSALLALALAGLQPRYVGSTLIPRLLLLGAGIGVLYSGYLTYLEAAVIRAWCMWCVGSAVLITLVLVASIPEVKRMNYGVQGDSIVSEERP